MNFHVASQSGTERIFDYEVRGNTIVLTPKGDLGILQEAEIAREMGEVVSLLQQSGAHNLVLDFANTGYFGTALLGAVVRLWKRVSTHGGRMAFCHVSNQLLDVLRVTKLHTVWPIYPSRQEALEAIAG